MKGTIEIQVRFADLDAYNHVNNAVYLTYFEVARTKLVWEPFMEDSAKGLQYLLVNSAVDYKLPIKLGENVYVDCSLGEVTGVRFTFEYTVHNGEGKIFAKGKTCHAIFDPIKGKPVRAEREWLKK